MIICVQTEEQESARVTQSGKLRHVYNVVRSKEIPLNLVNADNLQRRHRENMAEHKQMQMLLHLFLLKTLPNKKYKSNHFFLIVSK